MRAQLAGKPVLWATYPTEDHAHRIKLDAWLERILPSFESAPLRDIFAEANRDWLEGTLSPETLARFLDAAPALHAGMRRWRESLFARGDLARHMIERAQQG